MMEAQEVAKTQQKKKKMMAMRRHRNARISFSATLPTDVGGVFADNSICAVLYSNDPFMDLRESIVEMIREVGVCNWKEMEELVYCYIAVNSSDVHRFISDAFLSLFS